MNVPDDSADWAAEEAAGGFGLTKSFQVVTGRWMRLGAPKTGMYFHTSSILPKTGTVMLDVQFDKESYRGTRTTFTCAYPRFMLRVSSGV